MAKFIHEKREELGLTIKGLSIASNVPPETIENIEEGKELFVMENGAVVHGIKALPGEVHYYPGHISHFATCPNANQHRRR